MDKTNVTKYFKMAKRFVSKRSPEILTGIGIAGMVTTTVLAVKATPKALELIEEEKRAQKRALLDEAEKTGSDVAAQVSRLKPIETVKVAWKPYIPAMLTGMASIACLIGAQSVSARRHAALYSAYKLSETALTEYKDKVVETIGEKKEKQIKQKIAEDKVDKAIEDIKESKTKVVVSEDGDTWFIDAFSQMPFKSTVNKIDKAINELNRDMVVYAPSGASLSDFYDKLDLPHTGYSDQVGWTLDDGPIEKDISDAIIKDGKAYIVLDFMVRPQYDFNDANRYYG